MARQVLMGSKSSDVLQGTDANEVIFGRGGDDVIHNSGGNNFILGGKGDDTLVYNVDESTDSTTYFRGGRGDDVLTLDVKQATHDEAWFQQLVDDYTAFLNDPNTGKHETFDFSSYDPSGELFQLQVSGVESLNIVVEPDPFNVIDGTNGNDVLVGTAQADLISAFDGNDKINGSLGDDVIDGGNGTDELLYLNANNDIQVDMYNGTATGVDIGNDSFTNIEQVATGNGNDTIIADDNDNLIHGQVGNDIIHGNGGNDSLQAGSGNDVVYGGDGNDYIRGGQGSDTISSGDGVDIMAFSAGDGNDIVNDYVDGQDRFDLGSYGTDFASLNIYDDGGNAVIDMGGGDTVTLAGINSTVLDASDFYF